MKPLEDIERIRHIAGVTLVNDTLPRSIVIDIEGDLAKERLKQFCGWTLRQSHPVSLGLVSAESCIDNTVPGLRLVKKEKP